LKSRNRTLKNLSGLGIRIHRYMKCTPSEKMEFIRMAEEEPRPVPSKG
jgi:hypothetical protein